MPHALRVVVAANGAAFELSSLDNSDALNKATDALSNALAAMTDVEAKTLRDELLIMGNIGVDDGVALDAALPAFAIANVRVRALDPFLDFD